MKKILKLIGIVGLFTITKISLGMQDQLLRCAVLKSLHNLIKEAQEGQIGAALAINDLGKALEHHGDINFQPFEVKDTPSKDLLRRYQFLNENQIPSRILDLLKTMKIESDKGIGELMKGIEEKDRDPSKINMYVIDLIRSFKILPSNLMWD